MMQIHAYSLDIEYPINEYRITQHLPQSASLKALVYDTRDQVFKVALDQMVEGEAISAFDEMPVLSSASYYLTVVAEDFHVSRLLAVLQCLNEQGLSIERISSRQVDGLPYTCLVFSLSGALLDSAACHDALLSLSSSSMIDCFLQTHEEHKTEWKLACFDMDSTLIQCEVIDELAKAYGIGDQVSAITERAMQGELDFKQSFAERLGLLEGLSEDVLETIAQRLPLTPGVERLMMALQQRGIKTAIFSGGFTYFAENLQQRMGFDYVHANKLAIDSGKVTGVAQGDIVDAEKKAILLASVANQEGAALQQVIAVGDGANDLLMLDKAGMGVAFWAKPIVKQKAQFAISHAGLDALIYLL